MKITAFYIVFLFTSQQMFNDNESQSQSGLKHSAIWTKAIIERPRNKFIMILNAQLALIGPVGLWDV